jgi:hypothetical protein
VVGIRWTFAIGSVHVKVFLDRNVGESRCGCTFSTLALGKRVPNVTPRPLYPRYPVDRRLNGPPGKIFFFNHALNYISVPRLSARTSTFSSSPVTKMFRFNLIVI